MGIRMTQLRGLSVDALAMVWSEQVLAYTEKGVRIYPDGRQVPFERNVTQSAVTKEEYSHTLGMFDEPIPLHRYFFPDGRRWVERVQAAPWSSGPVIFLALQDEITGKWVPGSLWPNEAIERL